MAAGLGVEVRSAGQVERDLVQTSTPVPTHVSSASLNSFASEPSTFGRPVRRVRTA
jgi:hypothetical protein